MLTLKINTRYTIVVAALVPMLAVLFLLTPGVARAEYKTESIANVIRAKCDKALKDYNGSKQSDAFKDFSAACKATGKYKENGANKPERAARLIAICGYQNILKPMNTRNDVPIYNVYDKGGSIQGGDCDRIKTNTELMTLTREAYKGAVKVDDPALKCAANPDSDECDLVKKYLDPFIVFLSALVAVAVVIGIVSGALRYITASDDPQAVAAARKQIRGAIIALVAYIFLYAFMQWLVPGLE